MKVLNVSDQSCTTAGEMTATDRLRERVRRRLLEMGESGLDSPRYGEVFHEVLDAMTAAEVREVAEEERSSWRGDVGDYLRSLDLSDDYVARCNYHIPGPRTLRAWKLWRDLGVEYDMLDGCRASDTSSPVPECRGLPDDYVSLCLHARRRPSLLLRRCPGRLLALSIDRYADDESLGELAALISGAGDDGRPTTDVDAVVRWLSAHVPEFLLTVPPGCERDFACGFMDELTCIWMPEGQTHE